MTSRFALETLALVGIAAPAGVLLLLGAAALISRRIPEKITGRVTSLAMVLSLACFVSALFAVLGRGRPVVISFGRWFEVAHAAFEIDLLLDPASLLFASLTVAISGVVAAFCHTYLHREPGYQRYFLLLSVLVLGMLLVVLGGTVEVVFTGWELLGLSSALLVAFFHDRPAPVHNALRVFIIYRIGDAAMVSAALLVHHYLGSGSLQALFGGGETHVAAPLTLAQATAVGMLLVLAAAIKCAQLPLSTWLPRAMEGPTPSSAVFYGALSVHAGAYLLLRAGPILEQSPITCILLGLLGAATAIYATVVGRAQTDIKSALSFASLTQVSIILVEIAIGLRWIPMLHMVGHACMRLLQYLRAPSLIHDFHEAERNVGERLGVTGGHFERIAPEAARTWLYRFALERGYVDALLDRAVVRPFQVVIGALDRAEQRWCDLMSGVRRSEDRDG